MNTHQYMLMSKGTHREHNIFRDVGYENLPPPLPAAEERALLAEYRQTRSVAIRNRLVEANMRFVVLRSATAWSRLGQYSTTIDFADLIAEGAIALTLAVENHDRPDIKLISYAVRWIHTWHKTYIAANIRAIKLSPHFNRWRRSYAVAHRRYAREHPDAHRLPTDDEVWDTLPEEERPNTYWREMLHRTQHRDQSIDKMLGDDACLLSPERPADETMLADDQWQRVCNAISTLTAQEQEVLTRYYGLGGRDSQTLQAIATHMGVTRQRVGQIKLAAEAGVRKYAYHIRGHYRWKQDAPALPDRYIEDGMRCPDDLP